MALSDGDWSRLETHFKDSRESISKVHERINGVEREVQKDRGADMATDVRMKAVETNLKSHVGLNSKAHGIDLTVAEIFTKVNGQFTDHIEKKHRFKAFCKLVGMVAGLIGGSAVIWAFMHGSFG